MLQGRVRDELPHSVCEGDARRQIHQGQNVHLSEAHRRQPRSRRHESGDTQKGLHRQKRKCSAGQGIVFLLFTVVFSSTLSFTHECTYI